MKISLTKPFSFMLFAILINATLVAQVVPAEISFVRQAVKRMVFDENQQIALAELNPATVIGPDAMHPAQQYLSSAPQTSITNGKLLLKNKQQSETAIWFGGFNPFASYTIDLDYCIGKGAIGYEFSAAGKQEQYFIMLEFEKGLVTDVRLKIQENSSVITDKSIRVTDTLTRIKGKIILQMFGSGITVFLKQDVLPVVMAQADFSDSPDLRSVKRFNSFQSNLYVKLNDGEVSINRVTMALTTGVGLADIRAITYENGDPLIDEGRLWYTMSLRGRALPHHVQGVFSLNPTVFDLRFEGVILFDRQDGLLRNEIASHIFYDRKTKSWRGITTGFSAFANPEKEKKQLLAVESKRDPRKGFSVMKASPFGITGDVEDPHIVFDSAAHKWRILTCVNEGGYKAIMLESDSWNKDYKKIAGPVANNSTGTSIQKIDSKYYCFSGSDQRKIFIYTYPELKPAGNLKMDLPPWDAVSGTRVWPNVVELPEGYPYRFIALMMDRFNYPGLKGPNWTYGAVYLYHGF